MPKVKNIKYQKFGSLQVLEYLGQNRDHHALWKCVCDCKSITAVTSSNLIQGMVKSCGCLRDGKFATNRKRLGKGDAAFNKLYRRYERRAGERALVFILTKEKFRELTSSNCSYCGAKPKHEMKMKNAHGSYFYNTIDRVNNEKGYEISNTVAACFLCNRMKRELSEKDFIKACKAVTKFRGLK